MMGRPLALTVTLWQRVSVGVAKVGDGACAALRKQRFADGGSSWRIRTIS